MRVFFLFYSNLMKTTGRFSFFYRLCSSTYSPRVGSAAWAARPPLSLSPPPAAVPEHGAAAPQPPPARRHLGPPGAREVTSARTPKGAGPSAARAQSAWRGARGREGSGGNLRRARPRGVPSDVPRDVPAAPPPSRPCGAQVVLGDASSVIRRHARRCKG